MINNKNLCQRTSVCHILSASTSWWPMDHNSISIRSEQSGACWHTAGWLWPVVCWTDRHRDWQTWRINSRFLRQTTPRPQLFLIKDRQPTV